MTWAAYPYRKVTRQQFAVRLQMAGSLPCSRCGNPVVWGQPWELDHLTPVAFGGSNDPANLWPAHPHCNHSAGARHERPVPSRRW